MKSSFIFSLCVFVAASASADDFRPGTLVACGIRDSFPNYGVFTFYSTLEGEVVELIGEDTARVHVSKLYPIVPKEKGKRVNFNEVRDLKTCRAILPEGTTSGKKHFSVGDIVYRFGFKGTIRAIFGDENPLVKVVFTSYFGVDDHEHAIDIVSVVGWGGDR